MWRFCFQSHKHRASEHSENSGPAVDWLKGWKHKDSGHTLGGVQSSVVELQDHLLIKNQDMKMRAHLLCLLTRRVAAHHMLQRGEAETFGEGKLEGLRFEEDERFLQPLVEVVDYFSNFVVVQERRLAVEQVVPHLQISSLVLAVPVRIAAAPQKLERVLLVLQDGPMDKESLKA